MSWTTGISGTCEHCGLNVHLSWEDRVGRTEVITYCPSCRDVDEVLVDDELVKTYWDEPRACKLCGGQLEEWDGSCPRCGEKVRMGGFVI